jgi:hypothetical protein
VDVYGVRHAVGQPIEPGEFRFRVDGALHLRDELCKRADIDAHALAPRGKRFNERRAAADVRIEHEIAGTRERLDSGAGEDGRETSGVFVEAVRQATDRLGRAGGRDERALRMVRQLQKAIVPRFIHR